VGDHDGPAKFYGNVMRLAICSYAIAVMQHGLFLLGHLRHKLICRVPATERLQIYPSSTRI
jgi:hypothetical protein